MMLRLVLSAPQGRAGAAWKDREEGGGVAH